jgi:Bacterial PH domain
VSDFDFEPMRGLPERLPQGERMLWQGAPDWRAIARRVFHIRIVAAYFAVLACWRMLSALDGHTSALQSAIGILWLAGLAGLCCGILALLAFATARTTVYTLTSERLVMRYGIALPMTLNIPYRKVEAAAARIGADGVGDIPLTLMQGEKIAYAVLWPHARPWRMKRPEPMLRGIPDAEQVANTLSLALAAATSRPDARVEAVPPPDARSFRPAPEVAPAQPRQLIRIA